MVDHDRENRLRRAAVRLGTQLPEDGEEVLKVLAYAKDMVEKFSPQEARAAMQLVATLPDDPAEALQILAYASELYAGFLQPRQSSRVYSVKLPATANENGAKKGGGRKG